ncbi:DUF3515 domain-containing protein [Cellulomonas composti]|uniref:DUF3515 domain-containing protein n=1 Tax=Cellulomonas composti TaxID=266130 RepID=UPI001FEC024E|nr:DUF3515 domain-containing protein [Cellulomonas composti]
MSTRSPQSRPDARVRRAATAGASALVVGVLVGSCASPAVSVTPAPHATDPACAQVVLATPDEIADDLSRRAVTAQAATAWGDPAVVLRCGVEPLGPTTDRCVSVESADGSTVDWVVVASDPDHEDSSDWTFTTYGRVPAVQVTVPAEIARTHPSSFLDRLAPAIGHTTKERECLGLDETS